MAARLFLDGGYQEALRAVGAWLDVRGYGNVRIVEEDGALVIEASVKSDSVEVIRLDRDRIDRLCSAAKNDRGSALSGPIPGMSLR